MLFVVGEVRIPVTRTWSDKIGLQYLDRKEAEQACEKHFEYIKSILLKVKNVENRAIVEECHLVWDGTHAVPDNTLSPVNMANLDGFPDCLASDFLYTIREVQIWDIGKL